MGLETAIRAMLFIHMVLIALVARQAAMRVETKEAKIAIVRHSAIFWLISVFAVVLSMALSALILVAVYTRSTTYMRDSVMWGLELSVAGAVAAASAAVLRRRLSRAG